MLDMTGGDDREAGDKVISHRVLRWWRARRGIVMLLGMTERAGQEHSLIRKHILLLWNSSGYWPVWWRWGEGGGRGGNSFSGVTLVGQDGSDCGDRWWLRLSGTCLVGGD